MNEMDNIALTTESPMPDNSKHFEAAIEQIFVQLAVSDDQITQDQAEIDRLKAETRSILTEMQAVS
jgi:hypothetical protein